MWHMNCPFLSNSLTRALRISLVASDPVEFEQEGRRPLLFTDVFFHEYLSLILLSVMHMMIVMCI